MNDNSLVVDASAIIALLSGERFDRFDPGRVTRASISTVNLSEVLARLHEMGVPSGEADTAVARLNLRIADFDASQALATARFKPLTRRAGLSLGDRACLALGAKLKCPVVTADRSWATVNLGVEVILIR